MPQEDIHSVTVPGCVAGWHALHKKFGKLPWKTLFEPAIYFASEGFPVTEVIHDHWIGSSTKLAKVKGNELFLPGDRPPAVGEIFRNEPLAAAYRLVQQKGAVAFYKGAIAEALLATSRRLGGTLSKEDLAEYEPEWVDPISTTYRGWTVYELPPNGQGIAALNMLNIMEQFPLPSLDLKGSEALHLKIEAQKLAYQDLKRYIGDPASAKMPVAGLLSKQYAEQRAGLINRERASAATKPGDPWKYGGDTIYLSVVDREGNIVSLIQSIYLSFGSAIPVEGMGFHLQNRGGLFDFDEKHPNVIGPRKRPLHTIIPGFMRKGSMHVGFGIMGGFNQAQAHAQFVSNIVDHELNIQGALEAPRFTKLTFGGSDLLIEGRFPKSTIDALRDLGHSLEVRGDYYGQMGGGQAVLHDSEKKINYGASSPRKDGAAIPEPAPYLKPVRKK